MTEPITPEQVALARRSYVENVPVSRILAETGMSHGTLYLYLDGGPLNEQGIRPLPPLPRRRDVIGKKRKPLRTTRVSLVARLWRTAERQVRDIEERLATHGQEAGERERDVRSLAVLAKTLRELTALDEKAGIKPDETDDDGPRDIDEFRRELARQIDALVAARTDA